MLRGAIYQVGSGSGLSRPESTTLPRTPQKEKFKRVSDPHIIDMYPPIELDLHLDPTRQTI